MQQRATLLLLHLALVSRVHVGLHGVKQMCNFAGPTHESMDFCYLENLPAEKPENFKKVGIQLRKLCGHPFLLSRCVVSVVLNAAVVFRVIDYICVPTVRRNR